MACTTAQSQSRLRLQRQGSLPDWQKNPWIPVETPWLGEGFKDNKNLASALQKQLDQDLKVKSLPTTKPLHFILGRPRLACEPSPPRWRCYAQVIVEMRGRRGKQALWAAEGLAWVELDQIPPKHRRLSLARTLTTTAIGSIREGPQERPAARGSGPLAQAIQRGNPAALNQWLDELEQPQGLEAKRIALWLAVGHLAQGTHRSRIQAIKAKTPRETKARQLALDWLDEVVGLSQ